jgi:transposase InsO family protein
MEITAAELKALNIPRQYHWRIRSRLAVLTYAGDHGVRGASRRFDLDRKTIREWRRRWQAAGAAGLVPRYPAERPRRIGQPIVDLIEQARRDLHYGVVRTQIWLRRVHSVTVSVPTIQRICRRLGYGPLRRQPRRRTRQLKLFERDRPGESIQMDVKEVRVAGQKVYQYTALDDCTRYRILRLYPRKNRFSTLEFFHTVRRALPFPMQKLQMDNGTEFPLDFALTVQAAGIRTRYITPRRPQQNGKVERSHRIDDEEFWSQQTFTTFTSASTALEAWQHRYNHERFSMALNGQTPAEKLAMFYPNMASAPVISC